jgi:hypothetical protein
MDKMSALGSESSDVICIVLLRKEGRRTRENGGKLHPLPDSELDGELFSVISLTCGKCFLSCESG